MPTFKSKPTAKIRKEIQLDEVIETLVSRVRNTFESSFNQTTNHTNKMETIVHFLALLELVKRGTLGAQQKGNFTDIAMQHEAIDTPTYGF